jgi:hypothetical protein
VSLTLGELATRRKLIVAGTGYKEGQHSALVVGNDAWLSWVDTSGAACIVFAWYVEDDQEWLAHPQILRAGFDWLDLRPVPRAFAMSDFWMKLIAEAQKKKRRPPSGSKRKADAPEDGAEEREDSAA